MLKPGNEPRFKAWLVGLMQYFERPLVKSAKDCYEFLRLTWDENKIEFVEQFKVVLMNRAQRVLGIYELSTGGVAGTVAAPKLVFIAALKANACNIIFRPQPPIGQS